MKVINGGASWGVVVLVAPAHLFVPRHVPCTIVPYFAVVTSVEGGFELCALTSTRGIAEVVMLCAWSSNPM